MIDQQLAETGKLLLRSTMTSSESGVEHLAEERVRKQGRDTDVELLWKRWKVQNSRVVASYTALGVEEHLLPPRQRLQAATTALM
jgi:hypothetical protein